jgi:tRNA(Arg) A34 adenosine deaminase TadA
MIPPPHSLCLDIPEALAAEAAGVSCADPESRMRRVIGWSRQNIVLGGGPFAAAVFCRESGRCLALGVNRVVANHCSLAHAEIMALMLAQEAARHHNLSEAGNFVLCSSSEPCAQCFGALPWSGIRALEYGASREDVEAIGFDEGPKPTDWREALQSRGIAVHGPLLRDEASAVLRDYAALGGPVYNGG